MLGKKLFKDRRGDTIVEVLIAVAVMSLVLAISYSLANKNSQFVRTAQERGEAQKYAEEQLERLRGYITPDTDWSTTNLCFDGTSGLPTSNPASCDVGTDKRYTLKIDVVDDNTYTTTVSWDTVQGTPALLELSYRLPAIAVGEIGDDTPDPLPVCSDGLNNDGDVDGAGQPIIDTADPGCNGPNDPDNSEQNPECNDGEENDVPSDGRIDWPNDLGCDNLADDDEADDPVPFNVSPTSHGFPSWHLDATGGTKPTVTIRVSNPSAVAVSNIGAINLSDSTHSFRIASDQCSDKTLPPLAECSVVVEFSPPSGGNHNHFGNQGMRYATLNILGAAGSHTKHVSLSGKTWSNILRAGNTMRRGDMIKSYSSSCYVAVEHCAHATFQMQHDGNISVVYGSCWMWWGGAPDEQYAAMQHDGNFVLYTGSWSPVLHTSTQGNNGSFLLLYSSGVIDILNSSGIHIKRIFSPPPHLYSLWFGGGNPC
ncbi:MAG TPA: hypothetical protein VD947_04775 [Patescibacteria group bacterium]|nr:hypothetical protein [Patescibacteria group bacterium]